MTLPSEISNWSQREARQQPNWPDDTALKDAKEQLAQVPPLVFAGEARSLQNALGRVAKGEAFLLQAGDCAESFHEAGAITIRNKLRIILQMALVLTYAGGLPVVKVGRIAGQFAKPRSQPFENINGVELLSFRGHIINGEEPRLDARIPDPHRMIRAYQQSASTLNLLRAFTTGGFADLSMVHNWNLEFVAQSPQGRRYEAMASEIQRALTFMKAVGIEPSNETTLHSVDFWTSHEALLLDYEDPLTRQDSTTGNWYACSAHMLWVGDRTRQLDGAHVEFLRAVHNPIGVKVGPKADPAEIVELCKVLNPQNVPGRLTLIARMGAEHVLTQLEPIIRAVTAAERSVVWACDPMHGNTKTSSSGQKTRHFDDVMTEVKGFFEVHRRCNTWPGGIHMELTGDDVTECLGGSHDLAEDQLPTRYTTICDPRLNASQSADLAFEIAELLATRS